MYSDFAISRKKLIKKGQFLRKILTDSHCSDSVLKHLALTKPVLSDPILKGILPNHF